MYISPLIFAIGKLSNEGDLLPPSAENPAHDSVNWACEHHAYGTPPHSAENADARILAAFVELAAKG